MPCLGGRQGYRSYPDDIYLCPEAQLAHLYKTTSCEVDVAARRLEGDVIHVAAGALVLQAISLAQKLMRLRMVARQFACCSGESVAVLFVSSKRKDRAFYQAYCPSLP